MRSGEGKKRWEPKRKVFGTTFGVAEELEASWGKEEDLRQWGDGQEKDKE